MRFVNRSWSRTENDDFSLNIRPMLDDRTWALPVFHEDVLMGWKIIPALID